MPKPISSSTGNAPIKRTGHTASTKHGSNPDMQVKGGRAVRDLTVKGNG